jgi:uncharacterized protein (DUF983 family)
VSSNPGGAQSDPSIRPTSVSVLVVAGLAAAAVAWLLLSAFYEDWPPLPWLPIIVIAALATAELFLAQNTAARIRRKPGAGRVDPLAVARYAVLAKASSLAGALYSGFSAGVLAWLALEPTKAARDDVPAAVAGVIVSLALVAAALWLEHSCRVPDQPERSEDGESGRPSGRA